MARTIPDDLAEQIAEHAKEERTPRKKKELIVEELVPSGSTLIDLACTDTTHGAYMLGGFTTIPGTSAAGKTIAALNCLAECTYQSRFDDYDLIHDDAEERMAFDINYLFSERVADRLQKPELGISKTIQQFEANLLTLQKKKRKCIYVLDSFDSLTSDEELEKEMRKALAMAKSAEAAQKIAGSYGMEKAKIAGQTLRMINNYLEESKSLVIILQQLRQNVGGGMFDPKFKTSGGEAPYYYSNHQIWLTKGKKIEKKELVIGVHTRAKVVKNSATGKLRDVEFDIYYDHGIDNIGSCVDWMIENKFWKERTIQGTKGYEAEELDLFLPNRNAIIDAIEDQCLERKLARAVGRAWKEREDSVLLGRKPRYE